MKKYFVFFVFCARFLLSRKVLITNEGFANEEGFKSFFGGPSTEITIYI